jgi:hypothetical protein
VEWTVYNVQTTVVEQPSSSESGQTIHPTWQWRLWGYSTDCFPFEYSGDQPHWVYWEIPYWCIILPLTLASAYLLSVKPCFTNRTIRQNLQSLFATIAATSRAAVRLTHGWRGKTGMATLLAAMMISLLWARSLFVHDFLDFHSFVEFPIEKGAIAGIATGNNSLVCMKFDEFIETVPPSPSQTDKVTTVSFNDATDPEPISKPVWVVYLEFRPVPFYYIPYWAIIIPLTFFSALLLLFNSRRPCISATV